MTNKNGTLESLPTSPTKDGHIFDGWFTSDGVKITTSSVFKADTNVFAHWTAEEVTSYTIKFFKEEGSELYSAMSTNADGTLSSLPVDPTQSGKVFNGWKFTNSSGKTVLITEENLSTIVFTDNTAVYAIWGSAVGYTVTFYYWESDIGDSSKVYKTLKTNADGTLPSLPANPTLEGFKFILWTRGVGGGQVFYNTVFTSDTDVYACWVEEEEKPLVYYGASTEPSEYSASFVKGLSNSEEATEHLDSITVNASSGKYIYYAFPSSFETPTFTFNNFTGGFKNVGTVVIDSATYTIYRSTNTGLGSVTVSIR